MRLLSALLAAGSLLAPALTQPDHPRNDPRNDPRGRPAAAQREVRVFDFEERETTPAPVPQHWVRAQDDPSGRNPRGRPGFPPWNAAELDYSIAYRGEGSVRLPTRGGSTSLLLENGVVPVFESADYRVTARVRTRGLQSARAGFVVRFIAGDGTPITTSAVASEFVRSPDGWMLLWADLHGDVEGAAFIQVDLLLLQADDLDRLPGTPRGRRDAGSDQARGDWHVRRQDLDAAAWFDDVRIAQLPRVELACDAPGGVGMLPARPTLTASLRDLTGESLRVRMTVHDHRGRVVASIDRPAGAGRSATQWSPPIDRAGWYRARLSVLAGGPPGDTPGGAPSGGGAEVGNAELDFVWLAPAADAAEPLPRLGVIAETLPSGGEPLVPPLAAALRAGRVTLPAWSRESTPAALAESARALAAAGESLRRKRTTLSLGLGDLPRSLESAGSAADPWLPLLTGPAPRTPPASPPEADSPARALLDLIADAMGGGYDAWVVGPLRNPDGLLRPRILHDLATLRTRLVGTSGSGRLAVAWHAAIAPPPDSPESPDAPSPGEPVEFVVFVPWDVADDGVAALVDAWRPAHRPRRLTLAFECAPPDAPSGVASLVRKLVTFWAASSIPEDALDPPGAAIIQPWRWGTTRRSPARPTPEFAAWRAAADRLADRRVVARLPSPEGTVAYLLAGVGSPPQARPGAIVAWNDYAMPEDAVLHVHVGDSTPEVVDLFGNASPLPPPDSGGRVEVRLDDAPVFIEGIDAGLARFVASVRLDPERLEPTRGEHEAALIFENPWPTPLTGRYTIVEAAAEIDSPLRPWRLTPRTGSFSLASGERARVPIAVGVDPAEEAGVRRVLIDFDLAAERSYGTVRASAPVELGVDWLRFEVAAIDVPASRGGEPADGVVEVTVANTGTRTVSVELTLFAPDRPRDKGAIVDLAPGDQGTRRFVIPREGPPLKGRRVLVSLRERDTGARLNRAVRLP